MPAMNSADENEAARRWLKEVYRGDRVPQLTFRSV